MLVREAGRRTEPQSRHRHDGKAVGGEPSEHSQRIGSVGGFDMPGSQFNRKRGGKLGRYPIAYLRGWRQDAHPNRNYRDRTGDLRRSPRGELHEYANGPQRTLQFRVRYGDEKSGRTKEWPSNSDWKPRPEDVAYFGCNPGRRIAPAPLFRRSARPSTSFHCCSSRESTQAG
jgi:hypothetical protein